MRRCTGRLLGLANHGQDAPAITRLKPRNPGVCRGSYIGSPTWSDVKHYRATFPGLSMGPIRAEAREAQRSVRQPRQLDCHIRPRSFALALRHDIGLSIDSVG